jgi:hypothetical protein
VFNLAKAYGPNGCFGPRSFQPETKTLAVQFTPYLYGRFANPRRPLDPRRHLAGAYQWLLPACSASASLLLSRTAPRSLIYSLRSRPRSPVEILRCSRASLPASTMDSGRRVSPNSATPATRQCYHPLAPRLVSISSQLSIL